MPGASFGRKVNVAVCVVTFRRPGGLQRLLEGLAELQSLPPGVDVTVVVVDNDEAGSAHAFCQELRGSYRWPLLSIVEARRGIPHARNTAVRCAGGADFIAFIDDDEVPHEEWLSQLVLEQRARDADIVTGPVVPRFVASPPRWARRGKLFERPRYPTGTMLSVARTGNVLIRGELLRCREDPFDVRLALTGGSDSHFFMRMYREGRAIVWVDSALVYEWVPETRVRMGWMVRRAFRTGQTIYLRDRYLGGSGTGRAPRLAKAMGRIAQGAVILPLSLIAGQHVAVKALMHISFGCGVVTAALGHRYEEYRTVHGT